MRRLELEGDVHTRSSTHLVPDTARICTRKAVILLINPELHQSCLKDFFFFFFKNLKSVSFGKFTLPCQVYNYGL